LAAVRQDGSAIAYIGPSMRTAEVCVTALQKEGPAVLGLLSIEELGFPGVGTWADQNWPEVVRHLGEQEAQAIALAILGGQAPDQQEWTAPASNLNGSVQDPGPERMRG